MNIPPFDIYHNSRQQFEDVRILEQSHVVGSQFLLWSYVTVQQASWQLKLMWVKPQGLQEAFSTDCRSSHGGGVQVFKWKVISSTLQDDNVSVLRQDSKAVLLASIISYLSIAVQKRNSDITATLKLGCKANCCSEQWWQLIWWWEIFVPEAGKQAYNFLDRNVSPIQPIGPFNIWSCSIKVKHHS